MSKYECEKCSKTFTRKESLQYHMNKNVCTGVYHNDDSKDFNCKNCGKGFTTSTSMYRHTNHTCKIKKSEDLRREQMHARLAELEKTEKGVKTKKIPKALSAIVWDTYIGEEKGIGPCYVCEKNINAKHFECGHIISRHDGGKTTVDNLRPVCSLCNKSIGTKNMDEFKLEYGISNNSQQPANNNKPKLLVCNKKNLSIDTKGKASIVAKPKTVRKIKKDV